MCRFITLPSLSVTLRLTALLVTLAALSGCATTRRMPEEPQALPQHVEEYVQRNQFAVAHGEDVIGRLNYIRLEKGDTLADIARHFSLGLNVLTTANPGVDIWVPDTGERVMLPLSFILPEAPRTGIVINLAAMRLFLFTGNKDPLSVATYPVGVGTEERPSPIGQMYITRKAARPTWHVPSSIARDHLKKGDPLPAAVLPGPENPLGEYALYLSRSGYLIHGTNKPASIGLRATNGCMRLYPEDVKKLYQATPVKTAVTIVNQPYLLGQSNGVVYLEVHAAAGDSDTAEFDKIYARLRNIEKNAGRPLDWSIVKKVVAESRGIPVPIFPLSPEAGRKRAEPGEIRHPGRLQGRPEQPELRQNAWTVLAADMRDGKDAARLAAIINHQGPPIPARVVSQESGHRVIAGPFDTIKSARDAIKRLKIDLEIDGKLIEPIKKY